MQEKRKRSVPVNLPREGIKTADILALWKHGKRVTDVAHASPLLRVAHGLKAVGLA